MSNYTGPGLYVLLPQHAPGQVAAVNGANASSGAVVLTYNQSSHTNNLYWQIVHAGRDEYIFLNWETGLYMCSSVADGANAGLVKGKLIAPSDETCRWKIIPALDAQASVANSGTYYIVSVKTGQVLNVQSASTGNLSSIITYTKSDASNSRWFIRLPEVYQTNSTSQEYINVGAAEDWQSTTAKDVHDNESLPYPKTLSTSIASYPEYTLLQVSQHGSVNAGLLDQNLALQWVQAYIDLFGGDPTNVTIAGISAGAGGVMLQTLAYGGTLKDSLFVNVIAASPFLPQQHHYADAAPSLAYSAFAAHAGCSDKNQTHSESVFHCLVAQNSTVLKRASATVSTSGRYGTWAFLPVTDGMFLQERPSQQYLAREFNGKNALVGNNLNEGALFTPQNITTEERLVSWLRVMFPRMQREDVEKILEWYPCDKCSDTPIPAVGITSL
ncbi:hypothetical protein Q7P35_008241 [Cladosporium inversicolor]